ncbi:MAG: hypothetical protein K9N35_06740 [Candidatus Marinimicrobia bacterium]|nr:hypothetical protein [Candidatus Neomarinimicrobiota bacterium]
MGTGMKVVGSILREIDRSQKAAARDRAKRERDHLRRQKQLDRENAQQAKEFARMQAQLEKENLKVDKEKIKRNLESEQASYEARILGRREIRLDFLNRMQKGV